MSFSFSDRIANTAPYAFAEVDRKVRELKAAGISVIDFGVGDPLSPTPDFVIDALTPAGHECATAGYPSYIGTGEFRQATGDYLEREFGVQLDPETEITSTIGSKEAVFHFPLAFVNSEDIVICPTPGYPPYKTGTRFAGGVPYFTPLLAENNFLIDFAHIPAEICAQTKIIWINYPNSPTGKLAPRSWLQELVSWAKEKDIIIAADEGCYIDLYFDEKPVSILEVAKEGIITFYSLSKRNNMTGYRVGFAAGDQRLIAGLRQVKTNIDSGTPLFIQSAAIAALQDQSHVEKMRKEYREKKSILVPALQKTGLPAVSSESTFYLWQRAPQGMSGENLAEKLIEKGIVVTPGTWISDEAADRINPGENYVRFALMPTLGETHEAAERLANIRFYSR